MECCPTVEKTDGSCIPYDILRIMAQHYNDNNNKNGYIDLKLNKTDMVKKFEKHFGEKHNTWVNNLIFKDLPENIINILQNETFRHVGPQGSFSWLSTVDLDNVLKQYELKYTDFKFLGAVPIDFEELTNFEINSIDFNELIKKNITRFGVIFNLDEHYKNGSHWVSLFFDLKNKKIYFSDSVGLKPEKRIEQYINKIIKLFGEDLEYKYNKTKHQKGNSECGVYSINFILRLLKGKTFEHITNKRMPDEKINKCRNIYFNKK